MVYRGKPSAGCENCRKAKKRCGLEQPACSRCLKLKKTCSGYRDTTALQIQDESEAVKEKANRSKLRTTGHTTNIVLASATVPRVEHGIPTPAPSAHTPSSEDSNIGEEAFELLPHNSQLASYRGTVFENQDLQDTRSEYSTFSLKPTADDLAATYFFTQFTASNGHWWFLRDRAQQSRLDPVLDLAIRACGMAALDNVQRVAMGRDYSRVLYADALGLLNSALRDPKRSKTDECLIAVAMLGYYENLTCDSRESVRSWKAHIHGATQLLKVRGKNQLKSPIGGILFREIRAQRLIQCMWDEVEPESFLCVWENEMDESTIFNESVAPTDRFALLCWHIASLRAKIKSQTLSNNDAMYTANDIEMRMVQWSIKTMNGDKAWRWHEIEVSDSRHVWNGLVHAYACHPAASTWNTYRSMRIMMSRTQEQLFRRLNPGIREDNAQIRYYRSVRRQMTDEICAGIPTQLGHAAPAFNSPCILITAYGSVWPLFFAGTCSLERLTVDALTGAGPSSTSAAAAQTSWILDRLSYISRHVGLKWADGIAATLSGDFAMHGLELEEEDKVNIRFLWQMKKYHVDRLEETLQKAGLVAMAEPPRRESRIVPEPDQTLQSPPFWNGLSTDKNNNNKTVGRPGA